LAMLRAMIGLSPAHPGVLGALASFQDVVAPLMTAYPSATLSLMVGAAVVFQRRNSNALVREMSDSWIFAAWTAAAFVISVLQLNNVAPFLYFNF